MQLFIFLITAFLLFSQPILNNIYGLSQVEKEQLAYQSASQGYDASFIELVEMIYGKGYLSQGGKQSVKEMIGTINLEGLKVLDIGSGLGGPAIELAKHADVHVTGLEPQEWMVRQAEKNLENSKRDLLGTVDFIHMKPASDLKQFNDFSFDVIMSKETILHIPHEIKEEFCSEIYRVLKTNGLVIIMDWLHQSPDYSIETKQMMELDEVSFHLVTSEQYTNLLKTVGFKDISIEDITAKHAHYTQENIKKIHSLKKTIINQFGSEAFYYSLQSWEYQRNAFNSRELITAILRGVKN
jgi:phosphoethanolamine N-methyltransferase